ncbi:hypothetical protein MARPO_0228s0003 [Marchantia polymorpha]|uniref:Uncharacterized protein n=1 Tax=Marchantia polymorpha TaxID=3197 RepID=A0A2R6VZM1_MARPO|nr:hypothetical protein MARPO_0228s0003 [Marchantia polymorpha]|eukprot:PTQ27066.1 hypothetical protein MARPO_0228s0003 [Marchantia polymorpha]
MPGGVPALASTILHHYGRKNPNASRKRCASMPGGVHALASTIRSASNLLQRMMAKQPGCQSSEYKLMDAGLAARSQLRKGRLSEWSDEEREVLYDMFRAGFDKVQDELADARKNGNQVFMKEHTSFLSGPDKLFARTFDGDEVDPLVVYERNAPKSPHTNPTSMPDSLLLSMQPIFQIRHPVLMFPSMLRAMIKLNGRARPRDLEVTAMLTLRYSRDLFDWYLNHGGEVKPKVIDADDIINDRAVVRQLCIETGMDPDAVQYEWEIREEKDPLKAIFLSTINASTSVIPGLVARGLDFDIEKVKWKAEFGEGDGEDLAKLVQDAMPDYNYLLSQRTLPGQVDSPQAQD